MITYIEKQRSTLMYRILSAFIAFTFLSTMLIFPQRGYAQTLSILPPAGTMISISPSFAPPIINGITIHPEDPLAFDFIIGTGDMQLEGEELNEEARKLIKYFLASLTTPEDELWVNLSPYEKDRIIPEGLGQTEMGRDLLAQDYLLKQLTASLMYPEEDLGKEFWARIYKKAQEQYGTTDIPINTFNKIWIAPDKAVVYEHGSSVFVVETHLKVMLEEDFVALQKNLGIEKYGLDSYQKENAEVISGVSSEIVREILIPEIEREVNEGKTFANLRQIYNSMVLATWYKTNLKESLLGQIYVDQNKTRGVDVEDKDVKNKIYQQYVESFKKGAYNYIKEDYDSVTQQIIPRKYFSGGFVKDGLFKEAKVIKDKVGNILPKRIKDLTKNKIFSVKLKRLGKKVRSLNLTRGLLEKSLTRLTSKNELKLSKKDIKSIGSDIYTKKLSLVRVVKNSANRLQKRKRKISEHALFQTATSIAKVYLEKKYGPLGEIAVDMLVSNMAGDWSFSEILKEGKKNGLSTESIKKIKQIMISEGRQYLTNQLLVEKGIDDEEVIDKFLKYAVSGERKEISDISSPDKTKIFRKIKTLRKLPLEEIFQSLMSEAKKSNPEVASSPIDKEKYSEIYTKKFKTYQKYVNDLRAYDTLFSHLSSISKGANIREKFWKEVEDDINMVETDWLTTQASLDALTAIYDKANAKDLQSLSHVFNHWKMGTLILPLMFEEYPKVRISALKYSAHLPWKFHQYVLHKLVDNNLEVRKVAREVVMKMFNKDTDEFRDPFAFLENKGKMMPDNLNAYEKLFKSSDRNKRKEIIQKKLPEYKEFGHADYVLLKSVAEDIIFKKLLKLQKMRQTSNLEEINGPYEDSEVVKVMDLLADQGDFQLAVEKKNWFWGKDKIVVLAPNPVVTDKNIVSSSPIEKKTDGGINLNPAMLDFQVKRDKNSVPFSLPQQPIENMNIEGFLPVIINVTPVNNLLLLLGFTDEGESLDRNDIKQSQQTQNRETNDLSYNPIFQPMEKRTRFIEQDSKTANPLS